MNRTAITIVISIILTGTLFFIFQSDLSNIFSGGKQSSIPEGIILFYGDGCPHCKTVDDFISQNKIEDKVKFVRLEVWYDKNNQTILANVAQKCQITSNEVGVPFLYDGNSKCYQGDVDTINFFKNAAGIN